MKPYAEMSKDELLALKAELEKKYQEMQGLNLDLNMSRGKPCAEQLALSMDMMDVLNSRTDLTAEDGVDGRNYGDLTGIPEAKRLMAEIMGVPAENVIVFGSSSLNIMYDTVARSYAHGVAGQTPWCRLDKVKFLCVVPGYDRHFAVTQSFGIENVPVPMLETGPDMDVVEKLVSEDPSVKGIWCVPKYSNPTGNVYSDETVRRFARLKPAAKDFRIYWDNAYGVHHLYDEHEELLDIFSECEKAGNPDLVYIFASTSKVTFPGAGISAMASSSGNLEEVKAQLKFQTICYDKLNQMRHARYLKDMRGVEEHMKKHAEIIRPKFEMVENILEKEIGGLGIGRWTKPKGGYFISFDAMQGCAKEIVARCRKAGVAMTPAGATWPGGKDPNDSNIRIAPTYPPVDDLRTATELFALCVKYVSVDKLLGNL